MRPGCITVVEPTAHHNVALANRMRRGIQGFVATQGVDRLDDRHLERLRGMVKWCDDKVGAQIERRQAAAWLDDDDWLRWVYREALGREADIGGLEHWRRQLQDGMGRNAMRRRLLSSPEATSIGMGPGALQGFHESRVIFTRSLPPARRILDLGGTSLGSVQGSLLAMGYPYDFDELVIIDLPSPERHPLFQTGHNPDLASAHGPVRYLFRSMIDLDDLPDGSADLIVSGQSFEHITPEDGETMLRQVARLLSPDGVLALDTPNRAVTAIECAMTGDEWINPDHKIEYTHAQMLDLFHAAGLVVQRAHGLGYMPDTVRTGSWHPEELVRNRGMYAAIEDCYTLAYLVRRSR